MQHKIRSREQWRVAHAAEGAIATPVYLIGLRGLIDRFSYAVRLLGVAWQVRAERRKLSALSDRALHDIGVSRADVWREARRSFWDVPPHRQRV